MGGVEFDLTGYHNLPESLKKEMEEIDLTDKNKAAPDIQEKPAAQQAVPAVAQGGSADAGGSPDDAVSQAVKAERARMKALDELAIPGAEEIIAKAKYETGASPEQVALEIVKAHKPTGNSALQHRNEDAEESGVNNLAAANNGAWPDADLAAAEKVKALKEAIEKGREAK
jgi:anti-sigma28 factor (negative regulator of flagellin synthesis)